MTNRPLEPDCDAPPVATPPSSVVLVQPSHQSWPAAAWCGLGAMYGKFLSETIVVVDGRPYSHSVVRDGDSIYDARRAKREGERSVERRPHSSLIGANRRLGYLTSVDPGAVGSVGEVLARFAERDGPAAADRPLSDEPNAFSVMGMARLGILLLMAGRPGTARLGHQIATRWNDPQGVFCSELVAKAFVSAGRTLMVRVEPSRARDDPETVGLLADVVERRRAAWAAAFGEPVAADAATAWEQVEALTERLHDSSIGRNATVDLPVGDRLGEFPPSMVTPNDLFDSPSLSYVTDQYGDDRRPTMKRRERTVKGVKLVVAIVLLTPVSLVATVVRWIVGRIDR